MMITARAIASFSNLQCVVDAFDVERRDHFEHLRNKLHQDRLQKSAKEDNDGPKFKGIGFFRKAHHFLRDMVGIEDKDVPPTSFAELIKQYYLKNEELIAPKKRDWINRQCIAYFDSVFKCLRKSLFFCSKLIIHKGDKMEYLMKFEHVAHSLIAKLFADVAKKSNDLERIEKKNEQFATKLFELEENQKKVERYFETLWMKLQQAFDDSFDGLVDSVTKENLFTVQVESALLSILPSGDKLINTRVQSIALMLLDNSIPLRVAWSELVKTAIFDYKLAFVESPLSQTYSQLVNVVVSKIKPLNQRTSVFNNIALPFCIQKIIENAEFAHSDF
jgi:hypothetical protein